MLVRVSSYFRSCGRLPEGYVVSSGLAFVKAANSDGGAAKIWIAGLNDAGRRARLLKKRLINGRME